MVLRFSVETLPFPSKDVAYTPLDPLYQPYQITLLVTDISERSPKLVLKMKGTNTESKKKV